MEKVNATVERQEALLDAEVLGGGGRVGSRCRNVPWMGLSEVVRVG